MRWAVRTTRMTSMTTRMHLISSSISYKSDLWIGRRSENLNGKSDLKMKTIS